MTGFSRFRSGLTDATVAVPTGLVDGNGAPAGRRYDVYRNNVMQSLTDVMRAGFPVVRKLLGDENFDGLAAMFIKANPPTSPIMQRYGGGFPDFLSQIKELSHLGYLPDVARLETALRDAYHAGDDTAMPPETLGAVPQADMASCTFTFAAAVRLVASPWPLFDIWQYNSTQGAPKPQPTAQHALILRAEFDPAPHPLTPAQGAWTAALMTGATLAEAHDTASAIDADCDVSHPLGLLLAHNALTGLHLKDAT